MATGTPPIIDNASMSRPPLWRLVSVAVLVGASAWLGLRLAGDIGQIPAVWPGGVLDVDEIGLGGPVDHLARHRRLDGQV